SAVLGSGGRFLHSGGGGLDAMLSGGGGQQRSRLLGGHTVEQRGLPGGRGVGFTNDYPREWAAGDVEGWRAAVVTGGLSHSTVRSYQNGVSVFLAYVTEGCYGWDAVCESYFDTHPVQVFHEWNTAVHRSETEARPGNRPMSREELQAFFDHCDA